MDTEKKKLTEKQLRIVRIIGGIVSAVILIAAIYVASLPAAKKWLFGRSPLPVTKFHVPKLRDAEVTVYCISNQDGFRALINFVDKKENPVLIPKAAGRNESKGVAPAGCSYEERITYYSLDELESIKLILENGRAPDRYQQVVVEIQKRKNG